MESIPELALEEIEGAGTCRSLPHTEMLLFFPWEQRCQRRSLHDAWDKLNLGEPWHPLTLKGRYRHE